jgi:hypothetical protein
MIRTPLLVNYRYFREKRYRKSRALALLINRGGSLASDNGFSVFPVNHLFDHFIELPLPYKEGTADDAEEGLQDFIGQLDPGIGRGTVDIGPAQGIANHHDDSSHKDSNEGSNFPVFLKTVVNNVGNGHGLQPVGDKGYKHGERIEKEIPQKSTYVAYEEGTGWVQYQSRRDDDDVIQI